jgi:hypothetical protein
VCIQVETALEGCHFAALVAGIATAEDILREVAAELDADPRLSAIRLGAENPACGELVRERLEEFGVEEARVRAYVTDDFHGNMACFEVAAWRGADCDPTLLRNAPPP